MESIEPRLFLSGSVLAKVIDGNLIITGDAKANGIVVDQNGLQAHQIRVAGDKATLINGHVASAVLNGLKGDVIVRLALGADDIALRGISVPGNVEISQGAKDIIAIDGVTVGKNLSLVNSSSILPVNTTISNTTVGDDLTVHGDAGGQRLTLQSVEVDGETRINTGRRSDYLTVNDSTFHGPLHVDMDGGADFAKFEVGGYAHGPRTQFDGQASIAMGAGDDTLQLGTKSQSGNRAMFAGLTRIDGGDGFDILQNLNSNSVQKPSITNFESINPIVDTIAPAVSSTNPAIGATGVARNRAIGAVFSEAMNPLTLTASTFKVSAGSVAVAGTVGYVGTTATFTPSHALAASTTYSATITTGAKDLAGNPIASAKVWTFRTGVAVDSAAPTVSSTTPADGATGVARNRTVAAIFSEAMNPLTLTSTTFKVTGPGSAAVAGTVAYVGTTATFTPRSVLAASTTYTATVTTGAKDLAGNALAHNRVWTFTTGGTIDATDPTVSSTDPANGATGVALNRAIAATFSEAMNPLTLTTTTVSVTGPGSVPVVGTVTYVGTTMTFAPTTNLAASTVYTATITTGAKDLAGNAMASNKVWTFTTGAAPDVVAPTVTLTNPVNLKTNVVLNKTIAATFSESIDPATISTASFTLVGPTGPAVTGTVVYDTLSKVAGFVPAANLDPNTIYTARVAGGPNGVKDLAGNAMADDKLWTFTTGTQVAQQPINLGSASAFAVIATAAISSSGATHIDGDVGLHTGTAQGIPTAQVNGQIHVNDQAVISAQADLLAAYNDATTRSTTPQALASNMGGRTYTPGLYTNSSGVLISGVGPGNDVTLDAQGDPNAVFIFQMGSTLTTGTGSHVILAGGAKASNIFWQVGSSATLNTTSIFKGNILASVTITVNNGSAIEGRLLAGSNSAGAVTVNASTVTVPMA